MSQPSRRVAISRWSLFTALLVTACKLSDAEFRTLDAWLTCDECVNGERAGVAALKSKVISRLSAALVGPSPGRSSMMKGTFSESYELAKRPGPNRRQQYVDFRHANYVATYQKRAAVSLGDIGRPQRRIWFWNRWRAKRALDQAIADSTNRHYRADVLRVIKFVRATFDAAPFRGAVKPNPLSFGEVLALVPPPGDPFNGDEQAEIDEGVFPPSQVPVFRSGDTLKTFAVGDVGPHVVKVTNVGTTTDTELAQILVGSILDPGDKALISCGDTDAGCVRSGAPPIVVGPGSPFTAFLTLSRKGPRLDSLDFFKISAPPSTPLSLTAELEWRGPADLDLSWRDCPTFASTGNASGETVSMPERTSVVIPQGQCWILQISMRPNGPGSTAPGTAFARLRVTSP